MNWILRRINLLNLSWLSIYRDGKNRIDFVLVISIFKIYRVYNINKYYPSVI